MGLIRLNCAKFGMTLRKRDQRSKLKLHRVKTYSDGPPNLPTPAHLAPQAPFVNSLLLWLQAACHLFARFHLPSRRDLPSILIESRPARLVMAVTDF
jgi:hypothetical protein